MDTPPAKFDAARHELLQQELRRIGAQLHGALEIFSLEAGLVEAPLGAALDPLPRLERVLQVSDDAAHRTADLVELSYPLAEQTGASAAAMLAQWHAERDAQTISDHAVESFLDQTVHNMTTVGSSLSEVLLAHGYQDQGARVLRGVSKLLAGIDAALRALQPLAGGATTSAPSATRGTALRARRGS